MIADPPSPRDLTRAAREAGLTLEPEEAEAYARLAAGTWESIRLVESLAGDPPALPRNRDPGRPPPEGENPLNAWTWRGHIRETTGGSLQGLRVVVKDNVGVAGWPLRAGSRVLANHVAREDATVVRRLLAHGATLVGMGACEEFSFTGGSHTSGSGPVGNPYDPTRMAGGSTSGPAVLVATGDADVGVGTDQGGSVAIPAAWCGVLGIKPTYGLVPYTGVVSVEPTVDHVGFVTTTAEAAARVLDATAGPDGWDTRQRAAPRGPPGSLAEAVVEGDGGAGLAVGFLAEGFEWPETSDPRVDNTVRAAVTRAASLTEDVSVPVHRAAKDAIHSLWIQGAYRTLRHGRGMSATGADRHLTPLMQAVESGLRNQPRAFGTPARFALTLGRYLEAKGDGTPYAAVQNARPTFRRAYDEALGHVDVLALPTVPFTARPLPPPRASPEQVVAAGFQVHNTCAFDLTGHPVVSVPVGRVDGLPVGALLVARRGEESTLLRAARAVGARASPATSGVASRAP